MLKKVHIIRALTEWTIEAWIYVSDLDNPVKERTYKVSYRPGPGPCRKNPDLIDVNLSCSVETFLRLKPEWRNYIINAIVNYQQGYYKNYHEAEVEQC